jgi:PAS domain S-box-containing protein
MQEEYLLILQAISEVVIIAYTDNVGRITYANKKFCEISGYTLEELCNKDHRLINSGFHSKEFFQEMYQTISSGQTWRGEIRNKNKDGSYYWVDSQIFPIMEEGKEITRYVAIRFDITEKKNMQSLMLQHEKMASIGEMAAVVAHEINNPLAIINLSSQLLLNNVKRGILDASHLELKINKITKSIQEISKIVGGIKTISRNGKSDDFSLINLKTLIENLLPISIAKFKQNNIIFKVGEIPDTLLECRPDQISQILINLINNAQDAILSYEERWIELIIDSNKNLNLISIKVIDSGNGIDQNIADKILTPFFTTKAVGKGTGLGLSISTSIAKEHNGRLYFENHNSNTAFILEIPLCQSEFLNRKLEA